MRSSPLQSNFQSGEFSPLLQGRVDLERYRSGLATCLNYIPTIQGGLTRRPGTYFVAEGKEIGELNTEPRLVTFEFSVEQVYVLEFGNEYMRVFKDRAQVVTGLFDDPYEITTPYTNADIPYLSFCQSADVMYICHGDYPPMILSRTGHTSWSLTEIDFVNGPYTPNIDTNSLTPSATTGSITITAAAALFASTDVGRHVRMRHSGTYGWAIITAYTDSTHVTATVVDPFGATTGTGSDSWWLGLWSDTSGYPNTVAFYQDRLFFAGSNDEYIQRISGSVSGDYLNFSPSDTDGVVTDAHALSFSLNSNNVNAIRWITSSENGLFIGTSGSEWVLSSSALGEVLTPTNVKADEVATNGSENVTPAQSGGATLFVQRSGRKLRELRYFLDRGGVFSPDLTLLAEHITQSGIKYLSVQKDPQSLVWTVRNDGVLACMTYERDSDALRVGWHRHIVGGISDSEAGTAAKVRSVTVAPSPDGTTQDVWLVVERWIDGASIYHVEYITPLFDDTMDKDDAFFVDSGLTYIGVAADTISGLDHLEGETVSILAEGAVEPDQVVTSGAITLSREVTKAHIGLSYSSQAQLLRIEAGAADGTALGKIRNTHRIGMLVHRTLGLNIGNNFDELDELDFRTDTDPMNNSPALFTGIISEVIRATPDYENQFCWEQTQPLPGIILAVMPRMNTENG